MSVGRNTPPKAILVGSDLSAASDRVVRAAVRVALAGGAELHVVSAFAPPGVGFDGQPSQPSERAIEEINRALPAQLRRILPEGYQPASQEVRFGRASKVILERAQEVGAELIVLGPHRGTDIHAQFLGTTADAVLRGSTVPCLTVRGMVNIPLRRVIVAVDLTESTAETCLTALGHARWLGIEDAEGRKTHVRMVHFAGGEAARDPAIQERLDRVVAEAVAAVGLGDELEVSDAVIRDDDPATVILEEAERFGSDLIVVGTRRKGKRQGANLGSVSSAIARRSSCPVLLIPPL